MTARTRRLDVSACREHAPETHAWPHFLRNVSGTLLLAALVFAPWCWACTWPVGIHALDLLLLAATVPGLAAMLLQRDRPPGALMALIALILVQGWAMTLNSRGLFAETTGLFAPLEQPLPGWPGSVERDLSCETMARITALFGAALVTASLGKSRRWRRLFLHAIVGTAVSLVLFGCVQRWSRAGDIFWGPRHLDYFFATFRNVTNAGEFINLAVPLAAAAAWEAMGRRAPLYKAWTVCALAVVLAGSCICGSKIAPLLTVVLAALFLLLKRDDIRRLPLQGASRLVIVPLLIGAVALIVWGAGPGVTQDRWQRLFDSQRDATLTDRLSVDRACVAALPEAGLTGFGAGTFSAIFPGLEERLPQPPPGRWLFAHDDYLQTALEWGAVGASAWALYFFGAAARLATELRRDAWGPEDRTCAAGLLVSLAAVAAMALVDFPFQIASLQLEVAVIAGLGWSSRAWPKARLFHR
jgi:hypothetical protein